MLGDGPGGSSPLTISMLITLMHVIDHIRSCSRDSLDLTVVGLVSPSHLRQIHIVLCKKGNIRKRLSRRNNVCFCFVITNVTLLGTNILKGD